MGEPTHAFVPPPFCAENQDSCDYWDATMQYDERCCLPRSAHPASPPETFYQKLAASQEDLPPEAAKVLYENLDKLYDAAPPEPAPESEDYAADSLGGIMRKAGVPFEVARPDPAPEPEKLRRMAEEWAWSCDSLSPDRAAVSLARLLERVVRECAEAAMEKRDGGDTARDWDRALRVGSQSVLHHFGLSGPSTKSKP